jgi:hypothetical protein
LFKVQPAKQDTAKAQESQIEQKKEQLNRLLDTIRGGKETAVVLNEAYGLARELRGYISKDDALWENVKRQLFPYAVFKRASEIETELNDAAAKGPEAQNRLQEEFKRRYGGYIGPYKNDCYEFLMHIAGEAAVGIGVISEKQWDDAKKWKTGYVLKNGKPEEVSYLVTFFSSDIPGGAKIARGEGSAYPLVGPKIGEEDTLRPGTSFTIQPGCFVFVNLSPSGTPNSHWAIYTGRGFLVNRGGKINVTSFKELFSGIENSSDEKMKRYAIYNLFGTEYKSLQNKVDIVQAGKGLEYVSEAFTKTLPPDSIIKDK